jgi:hypothetical protein
LEIYVILARGRDLQGLEGVQGMQELDTLGDGGERVFMYGGSSNGIECTVTQYTCGHARGSCILIAKYR